MHHDPVAVLLCRTIETSLTGPMVALQDRFAMSAEMFPVVMLTGQTSRAHASGHDVELPTGTEEDRLNSLAARPVREVGEWRAHLSVLVAARPARRFALRAQPSEIPDFSNSAAFAPKKMRWDRL
jgi:hypothetical protein